MVPVQTQFRRIFMGSFGGLPAKREGGIPRQDICAISSIKPKKKIKKGKGEMIYPLKVEQICFNEGKTVLIRLSKKVPTTYQSYRDSST